MSEKSAEIVPGLLLSRGAKGRCRYSVEGKRALVLLCTRPGVSVSRMALSHGVNANLLRKWISQYADVRTTSRAIKPPKASVAVLLPVMALASQTKSAPVSSADSCIEIMCALATVRIRGAVDARALGVVLDCLAQRT